MTTGAALCDAIAHAQVSEAGDLEPLSRLHPIAEDYENFTRPLVPFDCEAIGE